MRQLLILKFKSNAIIEQPIPRIFYYYNNTIMGHSHGYLYLFLCYAEKYYHYQNSCGHQATPANQEPEPGVIRSSHLRDQHKSRNGKQNVTVNPMYIFRMMQDEASMYCSLLTYIHGLTDSLRKHTTQTLAQNIGNSDRIQLSEKDQKSSDELICIYQNQNLKR